MRQPAVWSRRPASVTDLFRCRRFPRGASIQGRTCVAQYSLRVSLPCCSDRSKWSSRRNAASKCRGLHCARLQPLIRDQRVARRLDSRTTISAGREAEAIPAAWRPAPEECNRAHSPPTVRAAFPGIRGRTILCRRFSQISADWSRVNYRVQRPEFHPQKPPPRACARRSPMPLQTISAFSA